MASTKIRRPEFSKRYFTLDAAESLLPRVSRIMERTIKLDKALDLLGSIEIEVYEDDYDNLRRITKMNKQFHLLSKEFYANIEKLEDMGCLVKDIEVGIIDFHSKFEGKEIFLCWKLGEKRIKFWHEVDSGYECRKPILDLRKRR